MPDKLIVFLKTESGYSHQALLFLGGVTAFMCYKKIPKMFFNLLEEVIS